MLNLKWRALTRSDDEISFSQSLVTASARAAREWLLRFFPSSTAPASNRDISLETRPFVILFQDSSTLRTNITKLKYYSSLCAKGNLSFSTCRGKNDSALAVEKLNEGCTKILIPSQLELINEVAWRKANCLCAQLFSSKGCARVKNSPRFFHLSQQLIGAGGITQETVRSARPDGCISIFIGRGARLTRKLHLSITPCFFISLRLCA
jgi:hypothetical protein